MNNVWVDSKRLVHSLVVMGSLALVLAACSGSTEQRAAKEEKPEVIALTSVWHYSFDSIETMLATSDLVVLGEVTAFRQGRLLFPQEPDTSHRLRESTITISEVLKGEYTGTTLILEEQGYFSDGTPYELGEMPWSVVGDIGVFFLKRNAFFPENHFGQIHPDGRILTAFRDPINGTVVSLDKATSFSHTPLAEQLESLAPDLVRDNIAVAVERVVSEAIVAQKPIWELIADDTELIGTGGPVSTQDPLPSELLEESTEGTPAQ